jgi:hypothetical protein
MLFPQVDVTAITERHLISHLKSAASLLFDIVTEWGPNKPPEVDWARMRSLEFQDAIRTKHNIDKQLQTFTCPFQDGFDDKVSTFALGIIVTTSLTKLPSMLSYMAKKSCNIASLTSNSPYLMRIWNFFQTMSSGSMFSGNYSTSMRILPSFSRVG